MTIAETNINNNTDALKNKVEYNALQQLEASITNLNSKFNADGTISNSCLDETNIYQLSIAALGSKATVPEGSIATDSVFGQMFYGCVGVFGDVISDTVTTSELTTMTDNGGTVTIKDGELNAADKDNYCSLVLGPNSYKRDLTYYGGFRNRSVQVGGFTMSGNDTSTVFICEIPIGTCSGTEIEFNISNIELSCSGASSKLIGRTPKVNLFAEFIPKQTSQSQVNRTRGLNVTMNHSLNQNGQGLMKLRPSGPTTVDAPDGEWAKVKISLRLEISGSAEESMNVSSLLVDGFSTYLLGVPQQVSLGIDGLRVLATNSGNCTIVSNDETQLIYGNYGLLINNKGIFKSTDAGVTWTSLI